MGALPILRIGIMYDGAYFQRVSDFYLYHHARHSRLSFSGLHEFLRAEIAARMHTDVALTRVVEAHYYRGRLPTRLAVERDILAAERAWDESLIHAGVVPHYLPMSVSAGDRLEEKGVDVALALDAFDLAQRERVDVLVLIAGDGDFYPLVRRLQATGAAVLLPLWDAAYVDDRGTERQLRAAGRLRAESTWTLDMMRRMDALAEEDPSRLNAIFVGRRDTSSLERVLTPVGLAAIRDAADDLSVVSESEVAPNADALEISGSTEHITDESAARARDGHVATLKDAYGFLRVEGLPRDLFFHRSDLRNASFSGLRIGMPVRFTLRQGDQGPVAADVHVLVPVDSEGERSVAPAPRASITPLWANDTGYPL